MEITKQIENAISKASQKYNVEESLIKAIIKQESNFNPNAKSHVGASGLMQLMPETAKSLGVTEINNIEQNIMGGTHYIAIQIKEFKKIDLALAAYNAGPGNVKKYNGIPPFAETQDYVKKVKKNYQEYSGKENIEIKIDGKKSEENFNLNIGQNINNNLKTEIKDIKTEIQQAGMPKIALEQIQNFSILEWGIFLGVIALIFLSGKAGKKLSGKKEEEVVVVQKKSSAKFKLITVTVLIGLGYAFVKGGLACFN